MIPMNPASSLPRGEYLDIMPMGIVILAQDFSVVTWNRTISEWTGIDPGEILGQDIRARFPHLNDRRYALRINQVFEGGPAALFSTQFHPHFIPAPRADGDFRFQRTSIHPIQAGGKSYAMLFIDDVTDLVSQVHAFRKMKDRACAEVEKRTKKEDALALANKKINLLSSITRHDILNQIMALKFYIELMREEKDPEGISETLQKMESLAAVIEHQVNFARDYQEMGIHAPAWQRVKESIGRAKSSLPTGGIDITTDLDSVEVYADPLFEKVFYNLIDNALKYGGPAMNSIYVASEETPEGLVISIEDNGGGIAVKDRDHLFKRGFGKHTGLGLFLCREILSITGIGIRERENPGKGARFELVVPEGKYRKTREDA